MRFFFDSPVEMTQNGSGRGSQKPEHEEQLTIAELRARIESGKFDVKNKVSEKRASYMVASATHALRSGQALGADVMIVDPPRKGLSEEVMEELNKPFNPDQGYVESASLLSIPDEMVNWANDVQTLIYVSCGFDALARDAERLLTGRGGWRLEQATGYILFPGSDHVETLCIFQRQ